MRYKYILAYLRLSNDDDDKTEESNSIKNQRVLIEHFVKNSEEFQRAEIVSFADDGFSGTNFERPDFKRMIALAKQEGQSCCIIVKDLSRFGRDTITVQNYIEKVFPFLPVRFIAINDYYDSNSSYSSRKDTEIKFKNLINGIYPAICSKNLKQVVRKCAEAGMYMGSVPPYGYLFAENTTTVLVIDEETAPVVRMIFDRRLEGAGYSEIARELEEKGIPSPYAYLTGKGFVCYKVNVRLQWTADIVSRILKNPVYAGIMENHKTETITPASRAARQIPKEERIYVEGTHKGIVTKEELACVAAMVKHPKPADPAKRKEKYLFSGKMRCGHCRRMMRIKTEYKIPKIRCRTTRTKGSECFVGVYSMEPIEKLVLQLIRQQAAMAEDTLKQLKEMNKTLDISKLRRKKGAYEGRLKNCRSKKMELYESFATGNLTKEGYLEQKGKISKKEEQYKAQAIELQEKIAEAEARKAKEENPDLKAFVKYKNLEALSYPIIQELIKEIRFYDPEHIEVIWNYQDDYMETVQKNVG